MADPKSHGVPIPPGIQPGVAKVLSGIGDVNMQVRGTSLGTPTDGQPAGFLDAVWAVLQLSGSEIEVAVPHALGRIPRWVKVWEIEDATGGNGQVVVSSVKKSQWTATQVKLRIFYATGAGPNQILLLVGG